MADALAGMVERQIQRDELAGRCVGLSTGDPKRLRMSLLERLDDYPSSKHARLWAPVLTGACPHCMVGWKLGGRAEAAEQEQSTREQSSALGGS